MTTDSMRDQVEVIDNWALACERVKDPVANMSITSENSGVVGYPWVEKTTMVTCNASEASAHHGEHAFASATSAISTNDRTALDKPPSCVSTAAFCLLHVTMLLHSLAHAGHPERA